MNKNTGTCREKAKLKGETAKEFVERITSSNDPTPILDNEEMVQAYELINKYNSYEELIEQLLKQDFSDFKIGMFVGALKVKVEKEKSSGLVKEFYNYIKSLEQTQRDRNQAC